MRPSMIAFSIAAAIAASPALATNLVTNGDFTDLTSGLGQITDDTGVTTATGWTTPGYNLVLAVADQAVDSIYGVNNFALWDRANGGANSWNGLAPVGNILALNGDFPTEDNPAIPAQGAVNQTVSGLTVGQVYLLDFAYGFSQQYPYNGGTVQNLTVSMGGATFFSGNYDVASHAFVGWKVGELEFTATSSSEVLSFLAYGSLPVPPFALVSDVSLTSVPELSTWALMLIGFTGLACAGRVSGRRKLVAA